MVSLICPSHCTHLVRDVVPVALGAKLVDEQVFQSVAHVDDAVRHSLDFAEPMVWVLRGRQQQKQMEGGNFAN